MKTGIAAIVIASAVFVLPTIASAGERVGDAALGAISGALVGWPDRGGCGRRDRIYGRPGHLRRWFHRRRAKPRPPRYVQQAPPQQWHWSRATHLEQIKQPGRDSERIGVAVGKAHHLQAERQLIHGEHRQRERRYAEQ